MRRSRWMIGALALTLSFAGATPALAEARLPQPSGTRFFVWTQDYLDGTSTNHLVVADARGGHERVLTHPGPGEQDIDPRISPDGRRVLFERDDADGPAPAIVNLDGTEEHLLHLPCAAPCVFTGSPSWAPGGRQIVYNRAFGPFSGPNGDASSSALYRSDIDGRHLMRLSEPGIDGRYEDAQATFSPSGYMVFTRLRYSDHNRAVFRTVPGSSHPRQLTAWTINADLAFISPATSGPTKDLVTFEQEASSIGSVATVPATCRTAASCAARTRYLTPIHPTNGPVVLADFNPSWSPDGRSIVYVAFRYEQADDRVTGEIWTMRTDGTNKRRLSNDGYFDFRPVWGRSASY